MHGWDVYVTIRAPQSQRSKSEGDLAQIPKLGESCSCSSSYSCSICGTSAPKREPDPSAIILFHHSDCEICRILEDEHEQEHDFSTSAYILCEGSETLSGSQAVDRKARQPFAEYELTSEVIDSPYVKPA